MAKLTDREIAEQWRYRKARDQLNPAWDGDAWEVLTKRQQTAFAKAEQAKQNVVDDFFARHLGPEAARKKAARKKR